MARTTEQFNVLARLVPEPSVAPVVHGDHRRTAAVQD